MFSGKNELLIKVSQHHSGTEKSKFCSVSFLTAAAPGVGLDPARIDAEARRYSLATLRRLGWILEFVKAPVDLTKLDKRAKSRSATRASMALDPSGARKGKSSRRWHLVENVTVEPDL